MSTDQYPQGQFEQTILPHIEAAYNLARWMLSNDQDAEDIVQESFLRAQKYFASFRGGSSRSWLLSIVRNACYTWLSQNHLQKLETDLSDEYPWDEAEENNPELSLLRRADRESIARALEKLPVEYRELLVLREMEEMSYKEIALVAGIPLGTVMSRLARARQRLKTCLMQRPDEEGAHEL